VAHSNPVETRDSRKLADLSRRTIVIYAPSLKFSGARHVGWTIIRELGKRADVARVHALVPTQRLYEQLGSEKIHLHFVPRILQVSPAVVLWNIMLRRMVARVRPDAVLNLANIAVPRVDKQFVLLHWPHPLHMDAEVARRLSARERIVTRAKIATFRRRLRHARGYFVQTSAAREVLRARYGIESKIMANAVDGRLEMRPPTAERRDRRRRILVFSHFYPHKNLEVVEELARHVFERSLPYVFVLTVDPSASRPGAAFLDRLRWAIETGVVENKGRVAATEIAHLYASSDVLLLPTLLESFSTTYSEALHFGVPIVTSDRDFARSVCGDAALYVDPLSAESIFTALEMLTASEELRTRLVASGRKIAAAQPSWREIVERTMGDIGHDLGWPQATT
jgi:glycosyltransferase involved in cell wall biosynthesis